MSKFKPKAREIYEIENDKVILKFHEGQLKTWNSDKRFVFMIAGTQGGKTSFGSWWLWREIQNRGEGDYLAVSSSFDLFKLKMLPEIRKVFEDVLGIGRYWAGDKVIELINPETGKFEASRADDPMWGRIILRSAASEGGLESATAKAAWLDEVGQDDFPLSAWEAIRRRLTLNEGRVLGTTTPYNLGWMKQQIVDKWLEGDEDIDVIQFSSIENPSFPQSEFEAAKKSLPDWKFKMFYMGKFERPAGMIYQSFNDYHVRNKGHLVTPFDIPKQWPIYVGVDVGAINTSTVWLAHDENTNKYYCFHSTLDGNKSTREHVEAVNKFIKTNSFSVEGVFLGTKSEKQQRIDWEDAGCENVYEPPIFDVESGIDKVSELFKTDRLLIFENQEKLIDELMNYSREVDVFGLPTEKIKDKNKFHRTDALRYAVSGTLSEAPMIIVDNPPELLVGYRGGLINA